MTVDKTGRKYSSNRSNEWYKRRVAGVKVQRRKKPPKWEKEGDSLYQEITDNEHRAKFPKYEKITYSMAHDILDNLKYFGEKNSTEKMKTIEIKEECNYEDDSPHSWGGLSVGPVWKSRLLEAGFARPTPIQASSFIPISKSPQNVILASTTGSGKTLAYLLPLLTTGGKKVTGMVWIVTPTLELAVQLRGVVQRLAPDSPKNILHVVGYEESFSPKPCDDKTKPFMFLEKVIEQQSPILAGSARMMQQLVQEMDIALSLSSASRKPKSNSERTICTKAREISKNLKTIVLDEADRLLKTEALARSIQSKIQNKQSSRNKQRRSISTAEKLVSTLLSRHPDRKIQIICASATVGRTLRQQLMQITQSSSMDKTAKLVTTDVRTKKGAVARKASLLPDTLKHMCLLLAPEERLDVKEKDEENTMLKAVLQILTALEPAPALVFPGKISVTRVREMLNKSGFKDIRGLDNIMSTKSKVNVNDDAEYLDWKSTPIYVIGEKLGRGLDLSDVKYALLLRVPSSAAGYTHLAGRTGRNGANGTAITFCQPREAPKLLAIADTLGLSFSRVFLDENHKHSNDRNDMSNTEHSTKSERKIAKTRADTSLAWSKLSESSLKRKTIAEIKQYLMEQNGMHLINKIQIEKGEDKLKKADFIAAVQSLHESLSI